MTLQMVKNIKQDIVNLLGVRGHRSLSHPGSMVFTADRIVYLIKPTAVCGFSIPTSLRSTKKFISCDILNFKTNDRNYDL